jgi:2-dehydro-3-deoxygluconokinase
VTDVVAFGEVLLRLSVGGGELLESAPAFDVHVAGSEANVAVALAALGHRTSWVGALPDSPLGRRVAATLRSAGVGVDDVRFVDGARLGTFYVELGDAPRPTRLVYDRAGSAFATSRTPLLPHAPARWAVVSGISAAVLRETPGVLTTFTDHVRAAGTRLLVDVNHRALLWSAEEARGSLSALLEHADVVVCSARDLETVFGLPADSAGAAEMLRVWAPAAGTVVLTRGADGASAYPRAGDELHEPGVAVETVVDPLGAGDAFVAGLLNGLLSDDLAAGLRAGVALGALARTLRGDHVHVTPAELAELLAGREGVLR